MLGLIRRAICLPGVICPLALGQQGLKAAPAGAFELGQIRPGGQGCFARLFGAALRLEISRIYFVFADQLPKRAPVFAGRARGVRDVALMET